MSQQRPKKNFLERLVTGIPSRDQFPHFTNMDGCVQCALEVKRSPKGKNQYLLMLQGFLMILATWNSLRAP